MITINLDYDALSQTARISPGGDCPPRTWSTVRRFFEERYPSLVENGHNTLQIPWWAFLSVRDGFRYILRASAVTNLQLTESAKAFLIQAKKREDEFARAGELAKQMRPEDVQSALDGVGFTRRLLPYQLRNVARLCGLSAGADFSVPGAGKTTEALALFFLTRQPEDRLLVIAPKNAFVAWEDELPACVPKTDLAFVRLTGGQDRIREILETNPKAVVISYHQLPRVTNELVAFLMRNAVYMFIDESHRMKRGIEGVHGASILSVAHLPKRKLLLSGTPMPNSQDDLSPQFSFLYPELRTKPEEVIEKLKNVFVRTTKSELKLKTPIRLLQPVPMTSAQERLYRVLATDAARHLEGLSVSDRLRFRRFATCVQYMLQAASNPSLLAKSNIAGHELLEAVVKEGVSAKVKHACMLSRKWAEQGHKVLIWSTFVGTVEHTAGLLADMGAHFIHGGVLASEEQEESDSRETKIREFNDPSSKCRILVANPAACSEGISLHRVCHRAIYLDRNYNAAHYLQSEDRIHRIGLPPNTETFITILTSPQTIDESVARRLDDKVQNMRAVLDDPDLNVTPLNLDDDDDCDGLDAKDIQDLRELLKVTV